MRDTVFGNPRPARRVAVLFHRWVGLALAGLLLVAGLTGALLAWYHPLDRALNPQLLQVRPPVPGAGLLDPLLLREQVQARHPQAWVHYVPLQVDAGQALRFHLEAPSGLHAGREAELPFDEVYVDPYTGAVLGQRKWGAIEQGLVNLMPFVYRLHQQLALGAAGGYVLGFAALLWSLDCFAGAYLTLPAGRTPGSPGRGWWARWAPAWRMRWRAGAYKLNIDLHRAGALWLWAMLFVLAWSSVSFNLAEVYQPVMRTLFATQRAVEPPVPPVSLRAEPAMSWAEALQTARRHMAALAQREGFSVRFERSLAYDPQLGAFHYRVGSSRDVATEYVQTGLSFDVADGRVLGSYLPTGRAAGDTVTSWLHGLHMGQAWGLPYRVFVTFMGLVVAMLGVTGVYIWKKKRHARLMADSLRQRRRPPHGVSLADE